MATTKGEVGKGSERNRCDDDEGAANLAVQQRCTPAAVAGPNIFEAAAALCRQCGHNTASMKFCPATGQRHPPCDACGLSSRFCPVDGRPHPSEWHDPPALNSGGVGSSATLAAAGGRSGGGPAAAPFKMRVGRGRGLRGGVTVRRFVDESDDESDGLLRSDSRSSAIRGGGAVASSSSSSLPSSSGIRQRSTAIRRGGSRLPSGGHRGPRGGGLERRRGGGHLFDGADDDDDDDDSAALLLGDASSQHLLVLPDNVRSELETNGFGIFAPGNPAIQRQLARAGGKPPRGVDSAANAAELLEVLSSCAQRSPRAPQHREDDAVTAPLLTSRVGRTAKAPPPTQEQLRSMLRGDALLTNGGDRSSKSMPTVFKAMALVALLLTSASLILRIVNGATTWQNIVTAAPPRDPSGNSVTAPVDPKERGPPSGEAGTLL